MDFGLDPDIAKRRPKAYENDHEILIIFCSVWASRANSTATVKIWWESVYTTILLQGVPMEPDIAKRRPTFYENDRSSLFFLIFYSLWGSRANFSTTAKIWWESLNICNTFLARPAR